MGVQPAVRRPAKVPMKTVSTGRLVRVRLLVGGVLARQRPNRVRPGRERP
ncbi:hypothetical protein TCARB_1685 [Thermofilum adornatum 1505]|uniref:Uncharacterized protein n=1 Tax=Thermofilum adornatum 1505 TaxID=697581 RepID=A0A3G1A8V9_9CREN|nr:hypothetical protein TCARB_1685 [Thermofilum adornatum 1505]